MRRVKSKSKKIEDNTAADVEILIHLLGVSPDLMPSLPRPVKHP
jgi:hypothetical protein